MRMPFALRPLAVALFLGGACASAQAGGYTEGPDLSNNQLAPTPVLLDPGSNVVQGTSGYTGAVLDRDFFVVTVPSGHLLSQLVVGALTEPGGAFSFIGMQAGSALTVDPDSISSGAALLGWHLYGTADRGTDILDDMGQGPDKIGFAGALPAGQYTFWVQELAPAFPGEAFPPYPYQFDFKVTPVPEAGTAALMLLGLAGLTAARRRR
jgi:MYXO-CTERM domain-containing protein